MEESILRKIEDRKRTFCKYYALDFSQFLLFLLFSEAATRGVL